MASTCYSVLRVPAVRVTQLDACGQVVTGACSWVASNGIVSIEQELELQDREDYTTPNGDGDLCITDTSPPRLKWINVTLTFCEVDPEMYNIMSAEPLVLNDAETPRAVGFRTREGSVEASNFAFEAWTRVGGSSNCSGGTVSYGYMLLPWVVEGVIGDLTLENAAATFTVTGRTSHNSLWGVGPYSVLTHEFGANEGFPSPLLTAITATDHRHLQVVTLPPPTGSCGCAAIPGALTIVDPGVGTTGSMTIPAGVLPAVVDWGDGGAREVLPVGTVSPKVHTYAAPGTYLVKLYPQSSSTVIYQGSVTVA